MKGFFITGTDTDAGKTEVACALIRELVAQGLRVAPFKPVAAGAVESDGVMRNDDALALIRAAGGDWCYELVNPYCFRPPVAPHLAATEAGVSVDLSVLLAAANELANQADLLVVEGAGGWMVPLATGLDTAVLAEALQLPVVLVVGMRLGCINHARLSEMAVRSSACELIAWIGSEVDPRMLRVEDNQRSLEALLNTPCWGYLRHASSVDARRLLWQAKAMRERCLEYIKQ